MGYDWLAALGRRRACGLPTVTDDLPADDAGPGGLFAGVT